MFLASYFIIDMGAIAIRAINFGACSQWKRSLQGFVYHKVPIGASVFVKGARFVASNFVVDGISYGLIGLLAFFLLLFYVYVEVP